MLESLPWLLPALIFVARVVDVSLGTVRTILVLRGHPFYAAAIGFCEILVWVLAAAKVVQNLDQWHLAVAYAAGFAGGNVVGIWLEGKLALGQELVRILSEAPQVQLAEELRADGLHVLEVDGRGGPGIPVEVLFVITPRRRVPAILARVEALDPRAVCTTSDIKRHASFGPPAAVVRARPGRGGLFRLK